MKLSFEEVRGILPHRYPMLMVDRIVNLVPNEKATGMKCVSGNEIFFQGHFPDNAVMPGVLQIETVAQVGAVALLIEEEKGKHVLLGGVRHARFYKSIFPGDILEIHCEITKKCGNIGFGKGCIFVDGQEVMSCEISFAVV